MVSTVSSISQSLVLLIKVTVLHLQKTPGFPVLTGEPPTTPPTVRRRGRPFSVELVILRLDKMTLAMKTVENDRHYTEGTMAQGALHDMAEAVCAPPRYGSQTLQSSWNTWNDGAVAFMFNLCLTSVSRF